ncbi:MAG: substrate-binding domain-containing protein, partial [Gemmatimonadaceae bacterium]
YMDPPLSSVRVAISDIGALGVESLLHRITRKNDRDPQKKRVSTELVIRRSTGAPYAERPPPKRRKEVSR